MSLKSRIDKLRCGRRDPAACHGVTTALLHRTPTGLEYTHGPVAWDPPTAARCPKCGSRHPLVIEEVAVTSRAEADRVRGANT